MTERWRPAMAHYAAVRTGLEGGGRPSDYASQGADAALAAVQDSQRDELSGLLADGLELVATLPDREPDPSRAEWPPPRWVCCSRVEDSGSGVPESEWLTPRELAEAAITFDSSVRRVAVVAGAMPEGGVYTDPHFGSTDLPPMGAVRDVDFDGLHSWALIQSRVDDGISRMDVLVDEGYTGLSIGLHPGSSEVGGEDGPRAQLVHVAMVSEAGYPRVAALPGLDEQGFGADALKAAGWSPADPAGEDNGERRVAARRALMERVKAREQEIREMLKTRSGDGEPDPKGTPDAKDKTRAEPAAEPVKTRDAGDVASLLSGLAEAIKGIPGAVVAALEGQKTDDADDDKATETDAEKERAADPVQVIDDATAGELADLLVKSGSLPPVKARAVAASLKGVPVDAAVALRAALGGERYRNHEVEITDGLPPVPVNLRGSQFRAGHGEPDPRSTALVALAERRIRDRGHEGPITPRMIVAEATILDQEGIR